MQNKVRELYAGDSDTAHRFRYGLLIFDVTTILFVIATSFTQHGTVVEVIDALFGVVILTDFAARIWVSTNRMRLLTRLTTLADVIALLSFLAPWRAKGLAFCGS